MREAAGRALRRLATAVDTLNAPPAALAPTLLLRPRARLAALGTHTRWDWALLAEGDETRVGSDTLPELGLRYGEQPSLAVALVVPGEDVLVLDLQLPPGTQARASSVAAYLMEDFLLEELEAVHIALSAHHRGGAIRAAAINAQCLADTLVALAAAGLHLSSAWVDHELLAAGRAAACCFPDGERVVLCAPGVPGFAGPPSVAVRWMQEQGLEADICTVDGSGAGFFRALAWPEAGRAATDLLQGRFEPPARRQARRRSRAAWLATASLLPVLTAAPAFALGVWHAQQSLAMRTEARALLAVHYPDLARAPHLGRALEAQARASVRSVEPDTPGFAALLGAAGTALAGLSPGTRPRLLGLRYQQAQGFLELQLEADSVEALQQLQAGLEAQATPARLLSASRAGERFEGRVRVGRAREAD